MQAPEAECTPDRAAAHTPVPVGAFMRDLGVECMLAREADYMLAPVVACTRDPVEDFMPVPVADCMLAQEVGSMRVLEGAYMLALARSPITVTGRLEKFSCSICSSTE